MPETVASALRKTDQHVHHAHIGRNCRKLLCLNGIWWQISALMDLQNLIHAASTNGSSLFAGTPNERSDVCHYRIAVLVAVIRQHPHHSANHNWWYSRRTSSGPPPANVHLQAVPNRWRVDCIFLLDHMAMWHSVFLLFLLVSTSCPAAQLLQMAKSPVEQIAKRYLSNNWTTFRMQTSHISFGAGSTNFGVMPWYRNCNPTREWVGNAS